ncbi:hypothetical protein OAC56_00500 [Flavobacteriaceae bacterium]|nr:hypothetical protein [Flavobacteriaceae bacterium]
MKQDFKDTTTQNTEMLSRGDAIKKIGGYAALTALGTFMILNPQKAQAQSIIDTGGGGGFPCTDGKITTCCPDCYDGETTTICASEECFGTLDSNGDCTTGTPCSEPAPFQGSNPKSSPANNFNFDSKYKSRYKTKYSKK